MALDLRARFRAPSIEDYSRGPSPLAEAVDTGSQLATQYLQKQKKADFAAQLKEAMANNPNLKDLAPLVTADTVDQIIPHVAGVIAKANETQAGMVDTPYGRMSAAQWASIQERMGRDQDRKETAKNLEDLRANEAKTRQIMAETAAQQKESDRAMREWLARQTLQMRGEAIKAQHPFLNALGLGPKIPDPYDESSFPGSGGPVAPGTVLPPAPGAMNRGKGAFASAGLRRGDVKKGYRYKGGDPSKKESWEPMQ